MSDNAAPVAVFFFMFGMPTLAFIIVRVMQHRERLEMLRHGIVPPQGRHWKEWQPTPSAAPRPQVIVPVESDDAQRTLRKGITLTFVGLALTIGLGFIGTLVDPPRYVFGPWLLGGLIPMFVGLAQVVTAVLFGATLPMAQRMQSQYGRGAVPPSPPPPQGSPFEGPYTYRPDPTVTELGQSSPPDRR